MPDGPALEYFYFRSFPVQKVKSHKTARHTLTLAKATSRCSLWFPFLKLTKDVTLRLKWSILSCVRISHSKVAMLYRNPYPTTVFTCFINQTQTLTHHNECFDEGCGPRYLSHPEGSTGRSPFAIEKTKNCREIPDDWPRLSNALC